MVFDKFKMIFGKSLGEKIILIFMISVLLVIFISCTPQPNEWETGQFPDNLKSAIIKMERTACYGTCPVYSLAIYGNGTVIYNGDRFVNVTGKQVSQISQEKFKQLVREFYSIGYFSLSDEYTSSVTDLPSTKTSIQISGIKKSVYDYSNAPQKLRNLEKEIDEFSNSSQWVKG